MRGGNYKADTKKARSMYRLIDAGAEELEARMEADPTIAYRILYDIVDVLRAADERKLGKKRTGARVKVRMSQAQLVEESAPSLSMEPFPEALRVLMNGRSQSEFCQLMGISQPLLSRLLTGKKEPDREICELAAKAAHVPPWYFREWRSNYVGEWVAMVLAEHPNISMTILSKVPKPEFRISIT